MPDSVDLLWRVGRKVGRTIYAYYHYVDDAGQRQEESWLIGLMDTPELAKVAVEAHNAVVKDHPANRDSEVLDG